MSRSFVLRQITRATHLTKRKGLISAHSPGMFGPIALGLQQAAHCDESIEWSMRIYLMAKRGRRKGGETARGTRVPQSHFEGMPPLHNDPKTSH